MAEKKARKPRSKPAGPAAPTGFYAQALSEAEQIQLSEAKQLEGLEEEIALLRLRLSQLLAEHPERTDLLLKGVKTLVRAVAAQYRLSRKAEGDLSESVLGVLRGIGGVMFPEGFDGGA